MSAEGIESALIAGNFVYVYQIAPKLQAQGAACAPDDPTACQTASRFSRVVLWISAAIYLVGVFTAFILGPVLVWWDSIH